MEGKLSRKSSSRKIVRKVIIYVFILLEGKLLQRLFVLQTVVL